MNDRLLYIDRMEMSISDASNFIQSLHGGSLKGATRIVTESAGFLPGSFEPIAVESSLDRKGVYYVTFLVGPAIFPNGEIFVGKWYRYKMAIQKQLGYQYVHLRHLDLRRTGQQYAPGFGVGYEYAMREDGVRLILSGVPVPANDGSELMVARIRYEPGMIAPTVEDIRDLWRFFWSPSEIVDPNENIDTILVRSGFQYTSDFRVAQSTTPFLPMNCEDYLVYLSFLEESTIAHALNARGYTDSYDFHSWEPRPFQRDTKPVPALELHGICLPRGVAVNYGLRKMDMYRDVVTDWGDQDELIAGEVSSIPGLTLDYAQSNYHTLLGIRFIADDDLDKGFVKVWVRDNPIDATTLTQPCEYETHIQVSDDHPFLVIPTKPSTGKLYVAARIVAPDQSLQIGVAATQVSFDTIAHFPTRPIILSFGGDLGRLWQDDAPPFEYDNIVGGANWWEDGGRIWFHGTSSDSGSKPVHVFRTPGPSNGKSYRITGAAFTNYQDSNYGHDNARGVLYIRKAGAGSTAEALLAVGTNDGAEFPATDVYESSNYTLDIDLDKETRYELVMESDDPSLYPYIMVRGYLILYIEEEV